MGHDKRRSNFGLEISTIESGWRIPAKDRKVRGVCCADKGSIVVTSGVTRDPRCYNKLGRNGGTRDFEVEA